MSKKRMIPLDSYAQANNETIRALLTITRRNHIPTRKRGRRTYVDGEKLKQHFCEIEPHGVGKRDGNGRYR